MKAVNKIQQVCSLLVCLLLLSSLAIVKQGEWMGHELKPKVETSETSKSSDVSMTSETSKKAANDTLRTLADGSMVINTTALASDISGYGGKVPLEITIKEGKIVGVKALDNAETKDFFDQASALLTKWNGKTIDEAKGMKVDAVSGATFSSKAIIGNMQRGLQYAQKQEALASQNDADGFLGGSGSSTLGSFDMSAKNVVGLIVVLMAAILPLFIKNRKYHLCQLVLNVVVLGFWCGAFLSYTSLIGYMAHGINVLALLVPCIMLITAFVYPLFGKKTYYCTHVCPFGSLQQVAGKCLKYKVKMGRQTLKRLDLFRQVLWALLMLCIWGGVWSDWTDYEPFSAFIFQSASWVVIVLAAVFVLLSLVVTRPYCRFVCPMGTLLKLSQTSK